MILNPFRVLGDVCHTLSKCILIFAIHQNHSAEGVSLITQALYCLVFVTRYLDLVHGVGLLWNFVLKIFYILSSLYILFLMLRVYARTREREKAWKFGAACLTGSAVAAPILMMIFRHKKFKSGDVSDHWSFMEVFYVFSLVLESTCILPQLLLLRQTSVPTVIDSFYLLTLGSYRAFYILNWIWRKADHTGDPRDRKLDPISVIFGVIQTMFYIDFAWVYYSRQRVKLRNGGLVDADDMRSGWLLRTLFGNKQVVGSIDDDDDESAPALGRHNERPATGRTGSSKWGSRGISVSADDGVLEAERARQRNFDDQEEGIVDSRLGEDNDPDAKMKDPDELARILDDDSDDDGSHDGVLKTPESSVGNGTEWRDGGSRK